MPLPSSISQTVVTETVVKKSRFIAQLTPVASLPEAEAVIAQIRRTHWDARHHCTALVLGTHADIQRSSDDGEPSGTAGVPMLEVLRHREVTDVVAVVTRYFGGVLLGAGGLVRAYSGAVSAALDAAQIVRRVLVTEVRVALPHAEAARLHGTLADWCRTHDGVLAGVDYGADALVSLLIPPARLDQFDADLAAATAGAASAVRGGVRVADV